MELHLNRKMSWAQERRGLEKKVSLPSGLLRRGPWAKPGPMEAFDPKLYALLHTGNPGDLAFYRRHCEGASTVLELGCGAGRILTTLVKAGRAVTGVDLHPGMCALARSRVPGAEVLEGDMRQLALGRVFDRVLLPYNSLYCVADDAEALQVLAVARQHLAPGGRVLFDGYRVDMEPADLTDDSSPGWLANLRVDGQRIEVFEQDRHWPATRDCEVTYEHRWADGRLHRYTLRHHYLAAADVPALLARAGLRGVALFGDFDERPLAAGDRLVGVAEAAA